jgi:uncharacterized protein
MLTLPEEGWMEKRAWQIIAAVILACAIMTVVELAFTPTYFIKSVIKVTIFLGVIVGFSLLNKDRSILATLKVSRLADLRTPLLLGVAAWGVIVGGYFIANACFDLSVFRQALVGAEQINRDNFIAVGCYMALGNSLLEEVFFRGFAGLSLRRWVSGRVACVFGSLMFALYHLSLMDGWFGWSLTSALILGCAAVGVFFYRLDRRGRIYNSWFVHMGANFGLNTAGLIMLGLI